MYLGGLPIRRDMRACTSEELIRTQLKSVSVSVSLGEITMDAEMITEMIRVGIIYVSACVIFAENTSATILVCNCNCNFVFVFSFLAHLPC